MSQHAEELAAEEKCDPTVVKPAEYLHDIGIKEAGRGYNSTAAVYQNEESPPVARKTLEKLTAMEDLITEIFDIMGHHHNPLREESTNFNCVYNDVLIVNIEHQLRSHTMGSQTVHKLVAKRFLTKSGKRMAHSLFVTVQNESI